MGRNSLKRGIWLLGRSYGTWYVSIQPGPWREERQNNGNSYNETKWLLSTKVTADVLDWQKVNKSRWELVWWGLETDVPGEIFLDKTCRCREKQIPFNWPQVFDPKPPRAIKWNRPQKQWKRNALLTGPPTVHQVWQYNQVKVGHRQEFSPREAKHWTLLGVVLMSQDTTTPLELLSPL